MNKISVNPKTLAGPVGPFDRAVRIGPWLFISGTSALTHLSGDFFERPIPPGIEEQARLTFQNIANVCTEAGYTLDDVYQIRYTIKDRRDIRKVHAVIREFLPNRGFISSAYEGELLRPEMLIEVEANAYKA
ncbi:MAG: RidA family protein [Alphaproteobacteria bacterium]